jgi:hypothetical protein
MRPQNPGCNPNRGHPSPLYSSAQYIEVVYSHRAPVDQPQIVNSGVPAAKGRNRLVMVMQASEIKSKGVCLGRAPFGQRLTRLQSHLIELIVLLATLSSALMAQTPVSAKPALDIAVTGVTQRSSDLFEIHYTLKNNGSVDLYLPHFQIAGSIELTSYSLLHRTGNGAWTNIGPSYDVASYKAKVLQPGAALSLVDLVSDSVVGTPPGTGGASHRPSADVQSCFRIRVGYYSGAAAWQQSLNTMKEQQRSHKLLEMPRMEFAYSEQFQIPSAAK